MLATVFNTSSMEIISQAAEPAVRLHVLVVDADPAVRSACAEIAASQGYAVESTGDLAQVAWSFATIFVVPLIALEGLDPESARRRSF